MYVLVLEEPSLVFTGRGQKCSFEHNSQKGSQWQITIPQLERISKVENIPSNH